MAFHLIATGARQYFKLVSAMADGIDETAASVYTAALRGFADGGLFHFLNDETGIDCKC